MDAMLMRAFQSQVLLQCRFLLQAAKDINEALKKPDTTLIFYGLQNLLTAGANISKALWGQGGKLEVERKPLRDSIGVGDDSPLREVTMRNNFEHFDERLDRWNKESKRHNIGDILIGDKAGFSGLEDIEKFRHFDPKTTNIIFWSQEFNLQNLVNEAQELLPKLEAEAKKPHWE